MGVYLSSWSLFLCKVSVVRIQARCCSLYQLREKSLLQAWPGLFLVQGLLLVGLCLPGSPRGFDKTVEVTSCPSILCSKQPVVLRSAIHPVVGFALSVLMGRQRSGPGREI